MASPGQTVSAGVEPRPRGQTVLGFQLFLPFACCSGQGSSIPLRVSGTGAGITGPRGRQGAAVHWQQQQRLGTGSLDGGTAGAHNDTRVLLWESTREY